MTYEYEVVLRPRKWIIRSDRELDPGEVRAKFFEDFVEVPQEDPASFLDALLEVSEAGGGAGSKGGGENEKL